MTSVFDPLLPTTALNSVDSQLSGATQGISSQLNSVSSQLNSATARLSSELAQITLTLPGDASPSGSAGGPGVAPANAEYISDTYGSFFGEMPEKKQDLVPTLVFLFLYVALIPIAVWRVWKRSSRSPILWRPCCFIGLRIIALICRLAVANEFTKTLRISHFPYDLQEGLLNLGFLFLCQGVNELVLKYKWATLVWYYSTTDHWRRFLGIFTNLLLVIAFFCGVVAVGNTQSGEDIHDLRNAVLTGRIFNNLLPILILITLGGLSVYWLYQDPPGPYGMPYQRLTASFTLLSSVMLLIVGSYRFYLLTHAAKNMQQLFGQLFDVNLKRNFYCLQLGPEFIATATLIILNWKKMLRTELDLPRPDKEKYMAEQGEGAPFFEDVDTAYQSWARTRYKGPLGWLRKRLTLSFHYY